MFLRAPENCIAEPCVRKRITHHLMTRMFRQPLGMNLFEVSQHAAARWAFVEMSLQRLPLVQTQLADGRNRAELLKLVVG